MALAVLWLADGVVAARPLSPPPSARLQVQPLSRVRQVVPGRVDPQKELAADAALRHANVPLRFAVPSKVSYRPETDGTWEAVAGGRLWRLRVQVPGATDLNFGFTTFWLPPGATLHIRSEGSDYFQGPYTDRDNNRSGQLWTPVVPGNAAVIELFVPSSAMPEPVLELTRVNAGYRDLFGAGKAYIQTKSESCEINVACPEGDGWRDEIRSVARYSVAGMGLCTGTLVMDAQGDFRSFFLTALHCFEDTGTPESVVVYWNYQSPTCGVSGGGSLLQNQSGATFRASKYDVDFMLIELDQTPDPGFNVYYAGWDRSGIAPAGCVGIHHPSADEKAISISTNPLVTVNSCVGTGGTATHWEVTWSLGVTERGSSGSAIWDTATHLIVGTLSGGGSDCAAPTSPDCYGKFSVAWGSGSDSTSRLSDWLDPMGTGVLSVAGQNPPPIVADGISVVSGNCSATNQSVNPGETVMVNVGLKNHGVVPVTNLVALLLGTNGVLYPSGTGNYGTLDTNGSGSQPFNFVAQAACGGSIQPTFDLYSDAGYLGRVQFNLSAGQYVPFGAEYFDTVTIPALPAGWSTVYSGGEAAWQSTSTISDTPPNSMFIAEPSKVGESSLVSPVLAIPALGARLSFRHRYELEQGYDGGVLEIKVGSGSFTDIIAAGGVFVSGDYDQILGSNSYNPLGGRSAWSGSSGAFVTSQVDLPAAADGQNVQLRWRLGTDNSGSDLGWWVDSVNLSAIVCCTPPPLVMTPEICGTNFVFSFLSLQGRTNVVEYMDELPGAGWLPFVTLTGNGSVLSVTNPSSVPANRFFRVGVR
ncbi:MAG: hypothetical protein U1F98_04290 [Verrucomicrobiota bacterium]